MEQRLAERVNRLSEAETIKMSRLSRELQAQGHNVISMSLGEPDFNTPDHIKTAAIEAINHNITHYPPVAGFMELRKGIAAKLKRDNNLNYDASQIIVSTGAKQSLINVMLCLLEEGDEVVIPTPYWVSYPQMLEMAGATAVYVSASVENDFKITPQQLEEAITDKTRMFLINSPGNPTGTVYCKQELMALAEVLKKHPEIIVVSDEIYEYITYGTDHFSIAGVDGFAERSVIVNGVSKGFAMTGWRIGYMAAPLWIAKACEKLQGQFTSGASSISQMATLAAMEQDLAPTHKMREAFEARREIIVNELRKIKDIKISIPEGAFYIFPEVSSYYGKSCNGRKITDSDSLCMHILENYHVALVPGAAFGAPNCIRISFAASENVLREGLSRVQKAFEELS